MIHQLYEYDSIGIKDKKTTCVHNMQFNVKSI